MRVADSHTARTTQGHSSYIETSRQSQLWTCLAGLHLSPAAISYYWLPARPANLFQLTTVVSPKLLSAQCSVRWSVLSSNLSQILSSWRMWVAYAMCQALAPTGVS